MRRQLPTHEGPFAITPAWVQKALSGKPGRHTALGLYQALATAVNYDTRQVEMTHDSLAHLLECSTKTIQRAVDVLEEVGAIRVRRKRDCHLFMLLPKLDNIVQSRVDTSVQSELDKNVQPLSSTDSIPVDIDRKTNRTTQVRSDDPLVMEVWKHWKHWQPGVKVCPVREIARLLKPHGGQFDVADVILAMDNMMADHFWREQGPHWLVRGPQNVQRMMVLEPRKFEQRSNGNSQVYSAPDAPIAAMTYHFDRSKSPAFVDRRGA